MAEPDTNADAVNAESEKLRRELANLRAVLAERADDVAAAASRATRAVTTPVKENPGLAGTAFILGGIVGLLLGLAIGQAEQRSSGHWYDRYRLH